MWGENDDAANIESHTQLLSDIAGRAREAHAQNLRQNLGRCRRKARGDLIMIRKIEAHRGHGRHASSTGRKHAPSSFGCSFAEIQAGMTEREKNLAILHRTCRNSPHGA